MRQFLSRFGFGRPRLGAASEAVRREGLTYLKPEKLGRIEDALRQASSPGLPGRFLEFGVALGGSAIVIAKAARAAGRQFTGFDVFSMIPPPVSDKDDTKSRERYEVIRSGQAKGISGGAYYGYMDDLFERVTDSFKRHEVPVDGRDVRLVKGLFEETWPDEVPGPIAFAHLDCDWYDPVKFCLNAIGDMMTPGGSIVLDDYHDYGGCRTATDEFLAIRGDYARVDGPNLILRRLY